LRELGYGLTLDVDVENGAPVRAEAQYAFLLERGPVQRVGVGETALVDSHTGSASAEPLLRGKTLLDMVADDYSDPRTRQESKLLMRRLLSHHLGGQQLQARRVFMELQEM
jgi:DNA repair protein RecO (recombination protein O)